MTRTLDLTDPATGEVFGTSPIASQSEVDAALESAAQAFAVRRRSTPVAEMPHGGFGPSGHGKDLSAYSFAEYTRVKHVMTRFA